MVLFAHDTTGDNSSTCSNTALRSHASSPYHTLTSDMLLLPLLYLLILLLRLHGKKEEQARRPSRKRKAGRPWPQPKIEAAGGSQARDLLQGSTGKSGRPFDPTLLLQLRTKILFGRLPHVCFSVCEVWKARLSTGKGHSSIAATCRLLIPWTRAI